MVWATSKETKINVTFGEELTSFQRVQTKIKMITTYLLLCWPISTITSIFFPTLKENYQIWGFEWDNKKRVIEIKPAEKPSQVARVEDVATANGVVKDQDGSPSTKKTDKAKPTLHEAKSDSTLKVDSLPHSGEHSQVPKVNKQIPIVKVNDELPPNAEQDKNGQPQPVVEAGRVTQPKKVSFQESVSTQVTQPEPQSAPSQKSAIEKDANTPSIQEIEMMEQLLKEIFNEAKSVFRERVDCGDFVNLGCEYLIKEGFKKFKFYRNFDKERIFIGTMCNAEFLDQLSYKPISAVKAPSASAPAVKKSEPTSLQKIKMKSILGEIFEDAQTAFTQKVTSKIFIKTGCRRLIKNGFENYMTNGVFDKDKIFAETLGNPAFIYDVLKP